MSNEVDAKLEELPHMRTAKLRVLWQELLKSPSTPSSVGDDDSDPGLSDTGKGLWRSEAFHPQASRKTGSGSRRDPRAKLQAPQQIKTGTKLLRQWRGETHNVMVVEDGFDYRNERSGARDRATDHRDSLVGPSFFGLKQHRSEKARSLNETDSRRSGSMCHLHRKSSEEGLEQSFILKPSVRRVKPTSPASVRKAGMSYQKNMTMAGSPAAT